MLGVKTQSHRVEMASLEKKAKSQGAAAFNTTFS
jgi:hypothetical protein